MNAVSLALEPWPLSMTGTCVCNLFWASSLAAALAAAVKTRKQSETWEGACRAIMLFQSLPPIHTHAVSFEAADLFDWVMTCRAGGDCLKLCTPARGWPCLSQLTTVAWHASQQL